MEGLIICFSNRDGKEGANVTQLHREALEGCCRKASKHLAELPAVPPEKIYFSTLLLACYHRLGRPALAPEYPGMKILCISGYSETRPKSDYFLAKPFSPQALLAIVNDVFAVPTDNEPIYKDDEIVQSPSPLCAKERMRGVLE